MKIGLIGDEDTVMRPVLSCGSLLGVDSTGSKLNQSGLCFPP